MKIVLALLAVGLLAVSVISQPAPRVQVGPLPGGAFLLNSGWRLQPAGKQIPLDTFPVSSRLSRDGRFLVILNQGWKPPSLEVLDASTFEEVSRMPVLDGWLGLTFNAKGDRLYVGGGSRASVFEFEFSAGRLTEARTFVVKPVAERKHTDFIGDVCFSPDGRLLYAADLFNDSIAVINPATGMVIERYRTGRRPYRILFHPDGKTFFVTSWTNGILYHHNAANGQILTALRLGAHPTDMVWREGKPKADEPEERQSISYVARIFVTISNTNQVHVVGVSEGGDLSVVERINLALTPRQPAGMTPSAVTLSRNHAILYVACSDANAVAVVDVEEARSIVKGFLPTGWYPTGTAALPDGKLVVLNGKGSGSYPNPGGPNPLVRSAPLHQAPPGAQQIQYVGRLQLGTASVIEPFDDRQLARYTGIVLENSPYEDAKLDDAGVPAGNPIPTRPGGGSPIKHVIYIVKENRTYDQVLGDMKEGNGDPSLTLFGEQVTPNHHKLAREFVLLDNFYVNADVSADGHSWSSAAIASDYVQKMWPNSYGGRRRHYDYEGTEPTMVPAAGYIWTNAASAGVSMRNYGWWCTNYPKPLDDGTHVQLVRDPVLARVTNLKYRAYDLTYPDVDRARTFIAELAEFEKTGTLPQLIFVRLGNDHTYGAAPGRLHPRSMVADNDYALGMIVEAVSRSRFWPATAIFVLEDDAQNGADHVDSHRSPAFVISPYVKRRSVDSTMYNTTSMLRTMELILGLRPMTHFDAAATPMANCFQPQPDAAPYSAEKPRYSLEERNPQEGPLAARTMQMDFSEADLIDDHELNDILWTMLQGTTPPAPTRSYFSQRLP